MRITELSDEIGSPHQQAFLKGKVLIGFGVYFAVAILLASTSLLAPMRSITYSFDLSTW